MNKYPECDGCANQGVDPDVCEACENADLFEPYEGEEDEELMEMSLDEFKAMFGTPRRRAA